MHDLLNTHVCIFDHEEGATRVQVWQDRNQVEERQLFDSLIQSAYEVAFIEGQKALVDTDA